MVITNTTRNVDTIDKKTAGINPARVLFCRVAHNDAINGAIKPTFKRLNQPLQSIELITHATELHLQHRFD